MHNIISITQGTNLFEPLKIEYDSVMANSSIDNYILNIAKEKVKEDPLLNQEAIDPRVSHWRISRRAEKQGYAIRAITDDAPKLFIAVNIDRGIVIDYIVTLTPDDFTKITGMLQEND